MPLIMSNPVGAANSVGWAANGIGDRITTPIIDPKQLMDPVRKVHTRRAAGESKEDEIKGLYGDELNLRKQGRALANQEAGIMSYYEDKMMNAANENEYNLYAQKMQEDLGQLTNQKMIYKTNINQALANKEEWTRDVNTFKDKEIIELPAMFDDASNYTYGQDVFNGIIKTDSDGTQVGTFKFGVKDGKASLLTNEDYFNERDAQLTGNFDKNGKLIGVDSPLRNITSSLDFSKETAANLATAGSFKEEGNFMVGTDASGNSYRIGLESYANLQKVMSEGSGYVSENTEEDKSNLLAIANTAYSHLSPDAKRFAFANVANGDIILTKYDDKGKPIGNSLVNGKDFVLRMAQTKLQVDRLTSEYEKEQDPTKKKELEDKLVKLTTQGQRMGQDYLNAAKIYASTHAQNKAVGMASIARSLNITRDERNAAGEKVSEVGTKATPEAVGLFNERQQYTTGTYRTNPNSGVGEIKKVNAESFTLTQDHKNKLIPPSVLKNIEEGKDVRLKDITESNYVMIGSMAVNVDRIATDKEGNPLPFKVLRAGTSGHILPEYTGTYDQNGILTEQREDMRTDVNGTKTFAPQEAVYFEVEGLVPEDGYIPVQSPGKVPERRKVTDVYLNRANYPTYDIQEVDGGYKVTVKTKTSSVYVKRNSENKAEVQNTVAGITEQERTQSANQAKQARATERQKYQKEQLSKRKDGSYTFTITGTPININPSSNAVDVYETLINNKKISSFERPLFTSGYGTPGEAPERNETTHSKNLQVLNQFKKDAENSKDPKRIKQAIDLIRLEKEKYEESKKQDFGYIPL